MKECGLIITTVRITMPQKEFLRNSSYNSSKLFRNTIDGIMQKKKLK